MPRARDTLARPRRFRAIAWACLSLAATAAFALPEVAPDLQALVSVGRYADALQQLEAQSAAAPRDARLIAQRAMLLSLQRRDAPALRLLEALSERQPELAAPHHLTALILAGTGDYEAARVAAGRALRADPAYGPALKTLGEIQARQSRQSYEQALRLDRNDALLRQKVDALADWLGPVMSPFIRPGALVALAPPAPPAPVAPAPVVALSNLPLMNIPLTGKAPPVAAAAPRVLVSAPSGLRSAEVAAATRDAEGSAVQTFNVVAGGSDVPTGFFGVPRLAVPAPADAAASAASAPAREAASTMVLAMSTATRAPRAATPVPVAVATSAPTLVTLAGEGAGATQGEVDAALRQWAAAWSRRDVAAYLATYATDFKGNAASRAAWERERRERIGARTLIRVELSEVTISVDGNRAEARFRQSYASDNVNAVNRKLLQWQREPGGVWLIRREAVEG